MWTRSRFSRCPQRLRLRPTVREVGLGKGAAGAAALHVGAHRRCHHRVERFLDLTEDLPRLCFGRCRTRGPQPVGVGLLFSRDAVQAVAPGGGLEACSPCALSAAVAGLADRDPGVCFAHPVRIPAGRSGARQDTIRVVAGRSGTLHLIVAAKLVCLTRLSRHRFRQIRSLKGSDRNAQSTGR